MFKKIQIPTEYIIAIRVRLKSEEEIVIQVSGDSPYSAITSFLDLADSDEVVSTLIRDDVTMVEFECPTFRGHGMTYFGSARIIYDTANAEYWARHHILTEAGRTLMQLDTVGVTNELWSRVSIEKEYRDFWVSNLGDDLSETEKKIRARVEELQAVIDSKPRKWRKIQKRFVTKARRETKQMDREDRKWQRQHDRAKRKGLVTHEPDLDPNVDMLDPHGDGTLREGDPLFDALMSNQVVYGNRTPTGWELETSNLDETDDK